MEMCDVYDQSGARTGRVVVRGMALGSGEYYLAVQVWIRDQTGEYLVQQRALHLASGAGVWATTAGYVVAGEDSISGAIREVNEELGLHLSPAQMQLFMRLITPNRIEDVWIADVAQQTLGLPQLGEEVNAWRWASKHALRQMISAGEFFGYSYFESLPE